MTTTEPTAEADNATIALHDLAAAFRQGKEARQSFFAFLPNTYTA